MPKLPFAIRNMDGYLDPNRKLNVWVSKNISVELKNLDGLFAVIAVFILDYMDGYGR